jgi:hypothetical protein
MFPKDRIAAVHALEGTRMNRDEEGMNTDRPICFAKQSNHPCSSLDIRVHHLQALQFRGHHHLRRFAFATSEKERALT